MKVGIILITHGRIGEELIRATEGILKEKTLIRSVAVLESDTPERYRQMLSEAVEQTDQGKGVLLLTDMFGATPTNLCLSFLKPHAVELVAGVNLPMLIKLATFPGEPNLTELVEFIVAYGRR